MITENKKYDMVSVVIPVYNEERYISGLIESLLLQDYDRKKFEVIFVDGKSSDSTIDIINNELKNTNIVYKILTNEKKITPVSLNIGIKNSVNDIIIRLDAHSRYPKNYITKCLYYINNTDADNVGCILETKSESTVGRAISYVLSSRFGVGNSKFRTNAKSRLRRYCTVWNF